MLETPQSKCGILAHPTFLINAAKVALVVKVFSTVLIESHMISSKNLKGCSFISCHWSLLIPPENIRKPGGIKRDQRYEIG